MYTKKVMEHFMHPRNVGEIKNADGTGEAGNIICGDVMKIYIKVKENKKGEKIISDIKFKTLGCVAAISTSSMITELVKGKTLNHALKITEEKIIESLGGLPPVKTHCSLLATDALKEAIYDYLSKNGLKIPKELVETHKKIEKELKIAEKKHKEVVKYTSKKEGE
ncbi:MAG: iron-sulfur cluster assembly scaffold protein [Candidatus Aenigmatarchaeota archaeon]|nr:MAG: iron-sulfur cluster assembly scaffold protein [Candidatus Aenigmarchaeota archaeon]